jgi:hypothetical protein
MLAITRPGLATGWQRGGKLAFPFNKVRQLPATLTVALVGH